MNSRVHAGLANAAYETPKLDGKGEFERIHIGAQEFVPVKHMDTPRGYQGTIYRNVGTGDYVVAHRGTEFDRELLKDGVVDLGMVTTRFNAQLKDALELTRQAKVMAERDGTQLSVTGHSLGGGMAQVTGHHHNLPGEAFNPYGAASLGYRIPSGQPAHAATFVNHVTAGDFVSAAGKHYGSVQMYALPGELTTLRNAEFASRLAGGLAAATSATLPAIALSDSHRMKHFVDRVEDGVEIKSVLDDPSARITAPDDQRRVDAYRTSIHQLRATATVIARGTPGLVLDAVNTLRGPDEPGAYAERQAEAARRAAHPFNPAEHRNAPGSHGGPQRERPAFQTASPFGQRLDELLNADPERFKILNQQMSTGEADHALNQQARNQVNAEDAAREHVQGQARQHGLQQETQAAAIRR